MSRLPPDSAETHVDTVGAHLLGGNMSFRSRECQKQPTLRKATSKAFTLSAPTICTSLLLPQLM